MNSRNTEKEKELRQFAAMAMQGLLANPDNIYGGPKEPIKIAQALQAQLDKIQIHRPDEPVNFVEPSGLERTST
jgi:hypothetical protein